MDTILTIAFLGGFLGVFSIMMFGFNPFTIGTGIAGIIIPISTMLFQTNTEAALVVTRQLVDMFPVLIMESLGASLALGIVASFKSAF